MPRHTLTTYYLDRMPPAPLSLGRLLPSLPPLLLLCFHSASSYTCPTYDAIRQPSVTPSAWDNARWASAGPWYVQATNERAAPNTSLVQCPCNAYAITVPGPPRLHRGNASYSMRYTAACGDAVFGYHNLTVPLEGFWNDTARPALHYENYAHACRFAPTMIYDAEVGAATGEYEWVGVYACEGGSAGMQGRAAAGAAAATAARAAGVVVAGAGEADEATLMETLIAAEGTRKGAEGGRYSWQLLSRQREVAPAKVASWVERARALGLDVDDLEHANWTKCPGWTRS